MSLPSTRTPGSIKKYGANHHCNPYSVLNLTLSDAPKRVTLARLSGRCCACKCIVYDTQSQQSVIHAVAATILATFLGYMSSEVMANVSVQAAADSYTLFVDEKYTLRGLGLIARSCLLLPKVTPLNSSLELADAVTAQPFTCCQDKCVQHIRVGQCTNYACKNTP
jgi:hypothetical protein